jgi:hypothetical protein
MRQCESTKDDEMAAYPGESALRLIGSVKIFDMGIWILDSDSRESLSIREATNTSHC